MNLKSDTKLLFRWVKRIFIWLIWKPKLLYLFFIFPLVLVGVSVYCSDKEIYIFSGTLLQVSGILLAVRGILNLRKFYGKSSPRQIFNNWLSKFPKYRSGVTIHADVHESGSDSFDAVVHVGISTVSDTDEERFNKIDKKLNEFSMQFASMQGTINNNKKEHELNIKRLKKDYSDQITKTKNEVGDNFTQDAWVEIGGLLWIAIGILLISASP